MLTALLQMGNTGAQEQLNLPKIIWLVDGGAGAHAS